MSKRFEDDFEDDFVDIQIGKKMDGSAVNQADTIPVMNFGKDETVSGKDAASVVEKLVKSAGSSEASAKSEEPAKPMEQKEAPAVQKPASPVDDMEDADMKVAPARRDDRPVRHVTPVRDPLADNASSEDIYSGRYKRETSDRGISTGGTRKAPITSRVKTSPDLDPMKKEETAKKAEAAKKAAKPAKEKGKSGNGKTVILLAIAVIVVCALGFVVKGFLGGNKTPGSENTEVQTTGEVATEAPEAGVTMKEKGNADVQALAENYFTALAGVDEEGMRSILDSSVTLDAAQMSNEGEYLEAYQDVVTYVADGLKDGEFAVYMTYNMKFKDIATPIPGLEPGYVRTDADGNLRLIPYRYFDSEMRNCVMQYSESSLIRQLSEDISNQFAQAQEQDPDLKALITALSGGSTDDAQEPSSEAESSEAAQETTAEAATEAPTEESKSSTKITFKEVDDIQYATTEVKCRTKPSTEGDEYVLVPMGDWVHVVGDSEEWCKVVLSDGTSGYIFKEFLSPYKPDMTSQEEQ